MDKYLLCNVCTRHLPCEGDSEDNSDGDYNHNDLMTPEQVTQLFNKESSEEQIERFHFYAA